MPRTWMYLKTQVNIIPLIVGALSFTLSPICKSPGEKKPAESFTSVYHHIVILPDYLIPIRGNGMKQVSSTFTWHSAFEAIQVVDWSYSSFYLKSEIGNYYY